MARSLAEADEMIAAAQGVGRDAGRWPYGALQPGGRRGAPARHLAAVHRGPSPGCLSRSQPRYRRRLRPDDSRSRRHPVDGPLGSDVGRGCRRAGADAEVRHCQRPTAVRVGMHRQRHRQPHQQGSRAGRSGSSSPTPICRSTTRRRKSKAGAWSSATARGRRSKAARFPSSATSRCGASSPTSPGPCESAARRSSTAPPAAARWNWRRGLRRRWRAWVMSRHRREGSRRRTMLAKRRDAQERLRGLASFALIVSMPWPCL